MITAEILGLGRDQNKNIVVWVAFEREFGEGRSKKEPIVFYSGKDVVMYNKRYAWPLLAVGENFAGRTDEQAWDWVEKNIKGQIRNIIQMMTDTYREKLNTDAENLLAGFIGRKVEADKFSYQDSIANNGIPDATIEIDETGNVTVK